MHLEGKNETPKNVFLTDFHDAEMMIISCDDALHAVAVEYLRAREKQASVSLREKVLESIAFIGGLRWINDADCLELNFRGVSFGNFYDGKTLVLDQEKCLSEILKRSPNKSNEVFVKNILSKIENTTDWLNLCNGHDFHKAFALHVSCRSGKKTKKVNDHEIGKSFRIAYGFGDFQRTNLYAQLQKWANQRGRPLFK